MGILSEIRGFKDRRRRAEKENALLDILANNYEPESVEVPQQGPTQTGEPLPDVNQEAPGQLNVRNAMADMFKSGHGDAALALQQKIGSDPMSKLRLEYQLKQELQNNAFKQMGGDLQPGQKMVIKPSGPEFTYDPAVAQRLSMDQAKQMFEIGRGGSRLPTKSQVGIDTKRLTTLRETAANRQANIGKAQKFLDAFNSGAKSGAGRKVAGFIPGVYTDQGQFDEEFDAFSETAARAALKASGEIRPTDADVKGMKAAMFGKGRDEETNKQLLTDYINEQTQNENEYQTLLGGGQLPQNARQKSTQEYEEKYGRDARNLKYKVGAIVKGPDGKSYVIRSLKENGTPDDVELVR